MNLLYNHLSVNQDGHLAIGGLDTVELAKAAIHFCGKKVREIRIH